MILLSMVVYYTPISAHTALTSSDVTPYPVKTYSHTAAHYPVKTE